MFFLFKCLACIALVLFALGWRGLDAPEKPSHASAPRNHREKSIEESGSDLLVSGRDALVAAARDKCLAAPRDCAALLQRLPGAARER